MATTTARKDTGRKAATAKRTRAAQKPAPAAAPEQPADNLDTLGMPELRQLVRAKGLKAPAKATKATLVALLRGESDPQPAAKEAAPVRHEHKQTKPAKKSRKPLPLTAAGEESQEPDKNAARCGRAYERMKAVGNGWSVTRSSEHEITAFNGDQSITVTFPQPGQDLIGGGYTVNSPLIRHHRDSEHKGRRLLNVSMAIKVMKGEIK